MSRAGPTGTSPSSAEAPSRSLRNPSASTLAAAEALAAAAAAATAATAETAARAARDSAAAGDAHDGDDAGCVGGVSGGGGHSHRTLASRREKNRLAAKRCRDRKQAHLLALEAELSKQQAANEALARHVEALVGLYQQVC
ncbi:hypothetical protein GPECTOR_478g411 [Gonium pectorale]|uniref:BZIP domain-containing protein n=1 Tax=Gonium pectorale TaxID=33097 RepID=A0A150FWK5_GONPE|nr:hypothetical protein GPECTOR_478g411 [Gonium pectorale]|eukprot:KXZ41420.1 hypothetical protein GPECTOR_478g411 [Gonium pectorale]